MIGFSGIREFCEGARARRAGTPGNLPEGGAECHHDRHIHWSIFDRGSPVETHEVAQGPGTVPPEHRQQGEQDLTGHPRVAVGSMTPDHRHSEPGRENLETGVAEAKNARQSARIEDEPRRPCGSLDARLGEDREVERDVVTDQDSMRADRVETEQSVADPGRRCDRASVYPVDGGGLRWNRPSRVHERHHARTGAPALEGNGRQRHDRVATRIQAGRLEVDSDEPGSKSASSGVASMTIRRRQSRVSRGSAMLPPQAGMKSVA